MQRERIGSMTQELVDILIDKILVFPGDRIEVKWKLPGFADATRNEMEGFVNAV